MIDPDVPWEIYFYSPIKGGVKNKVFTRMKIVFDDAEGPRAPLASPNIFIAPADPRPSLMTDVSQAFGKFWGSSTFRPFTSLKLWRTLKCFQSCGWTLWRRSRTPSSTRQMLERVCWRGFFLFFFFCCFGTSSPELSMPFLGTYSRG